MRLVISEGSRELSPKSGNPVPQDFFLSSGYDFTIFIWIFPSPNVKKLGNTSTRSKLLID